MLRLNFYHMHWDLSECIIYFATTFSQMDAHIQKHYTNYKPFDHVDYAEEDLILGEKRCFEECEKLGGLTYYVDFLTDFVKST